MSSVVDEVAGDERIGEVPGITEGARFSSRQALALAGVHRQRRAGITGTAERGAESIVLSGGYEDIDRDDTIIYTGHGGQNEAKEQVADQDFSASGNAALRTSMITSSPVRVVRGRGKTVLRNKHVFNPPVKGYRYDGLYFVTECWYEQIGKFRLCRFAMVKADLMEAASSVEFELAAEKWHGDLPAGNLSPGRRTITGSRVVRSAEVANIVKQIYDYRCQICGNRLEVSGRGYAEGAHIRAVSGGHGGPDIPENMLCLCPNCHVQFDYGAIVVNDDYTFTRNGEPAGKLSKDPAHRIGKKYLAYHRERYGV